MSGRIGETGGWHALPGTGRLRGTRALTPDSAASPATLAAALDQKDDLRKLAKDEESFRVRETAKKYLPD